MREDFPTPVPTPQFRASLPACKFPLSPRLPFVPYRLLDEGTDGAWCSQGVSAGHGRSLKACRPCCSGSSRRSAGLCRGEPFMIRKAERRMLALLLSRPPFPPSAARALAHCVPALRLALHRLAAFRRSGLTLAHCVPACSLRRPWAATSLTGPSLPTPSLSPQPWRQRRAQKPQPQPQRPLTCGRHCTSRPAQSRRSTTT